MLRNLPNKLGGVVVMFSAILARASRPWLDAAKANTSRDGPLAKPFFWIFVVVCILLGWLGGKPPEGIYVIAGRILTFSHLAHFLIVLPVLSRIQAPPP